MKKIISAAKLSFLLFIFVFISGCTWFSYQKGEQITYPNDEYKIYKSDVTGASYGWKFLCFLAISTPNYAESLDKMWSESGIQISERKNYKIVNLNENWGTSWTILLIGQNYLKLTGDIVKYKK